MSAARIVLALVVVALFCAPSASAANALLCRDAPPAFVCRSVEDRVERTMDDLADLEVPEVDDLPALPDLDEAEVPEWPDVDPEDVVERIPGDPDVSRPCSFLPPTAPLDMPDGVREPLRQAGLGGLADWWDRAGDDLSEPRRFCERL